MGKRFGPPNKVKRIANDPKLLPLNNRSLNLGSNNSGDNVDKE